MNRMHAMQCNEEGRTVMPRKKSSPSRSGQKKREFSPSAPSPSTPLEEQWGRSQTNRGIGKTVKPRVKKTRSKG